MNTNLELGNTILQLFYLKSIWYENEWKPNKSEIS